MKAIITNKFTVIQNPSNEIVRSLEMLMSYTDKQKQYQLRRAKSNPFQRNAGWIKKLEKEVNCSLLKAMAGGHVAFNSGLSYRIANQSAFAIDDRRSETGTTIAMPWKKAPFSLRPYQEEAVEVALKCWRGVINFATGLGKTLVAVHLIKKLRKKSLIVVPSESIAKQFYKELSDAFGENRIGYYGGGKKKIKDITVGIAASVVKNTEEFSKAGLGVIIFDEVHHIAATTFYEIACNLGDIGRIYGLTATDYRSDGKDILINAGCGPVIIKRDIKWGINNGYLAKPKFKIKVVDTIGANYAKDKLKNYKAHVLNSDIMKQQIKDDMKSYMDQGKSVLCLVGEVAHGEELSKQLGVPFAQGKDKKSQGYVDDLNAGKIAGLVGTGGKVGEGTDTKRVDVLILANFVASKGPVIQAVGRGLRIYGSKTECIVKDYVPKGSTMLSRHAYSRIDFYKEITHDVMVE
jgi:superfamily II DNA or RNA helicase